MRWIIGDIHGMGRSLEALLDTILRRDADASFFFVGDYVNRGPDSASVIDRLIHLPHARFARGNHDDVFDLILNGKCYADQDGKLEPVFGFEWFMQHGLETTLLSYGLTAAQITALRRNVTVEKLRTALAVVPDAHRAFLRKLEPVIEEPDLFVAHAMWQPTDDSERPDIVSHLVQNPGLRHNILWGRFRTEQILGKKKWSRTGYFGHTPVVNYGEIVVDKNIPAIGPRVVLLDTGCALSPYGRLSAICAETQNLVQADPLGTIVTNEPWF